MARDKNPTLTSSCIICRNRIVNKLQINGGDSIANVVHWKALSLEAFFMLFGLPTEEDDQGSSLVLHNHLNKKAQFCNQCLQDSNDAQYVFWQLRNLEGVLRGCQERMLKRLRSNYDAVPVATLFSTVGMADIRNDLKDFSYDQLVKILFECITDRRDEWPKPSYRRKWKQAKENADKVSKTILLENAHCDMEADTVVVGPPSIKVEDDEVDVDNGANCNEMPEPADDNPVSDCTIRKSSRTRRRPRRIRIVSSKPSRCKKIQDSVVGDTDPGYQNEEGLDITAPDDDSTIDRLKHEHPSQIILPKKQTNRRMTFQSKIKALTVSQDGKEAFECMEEPEICNKVFRNMRQLKYHVKVFHMDRRFLCDQEGCTRSFKTEETLETHQDRAHSLHPNPRTEVCDKCGEEVKRGFMKKHYYLRHVGVGSFSCDICSMDFNESEAFSEHELLHQKAEFPFMCVVCPQLFTNSADLKSHVSSNHLLSGLKCEKCGIMKANQYLLQQHMRTHDKKKKFVCECGKSFVSKGYLNYHKEHFHTNVGKTFPCEICGKSFLHLKNAVRHLVIHQEDKPFKCKICQKTFNYNHLLKKHEEIHSGTKNYGCEMCGKRFRQAQNLTQHMRSHKPKPAKPKPTTKKKVRKSKVLPSTSPSCADNQEGEESVPIIMDVKGDVGSYKIENEEGKVVGEPEVATTTTIALPVENAVGHFETVHEIREIQISHANMEPQTATVLFVTTDPNFQWIT